MSQMVAVQSSDAETSRVESGEKSTPLMKPPRSCQKTFSYVFASHTNTSPRPVPAAIHLPSLDTVRHLTSTALIVVICSPSFTRHTRTPSRSTLKRDSPFAENVIVCTRSPKLISIAGLDDQHQRALHLVSTHRSLSTTWASNDTI